MAAKCRHLQRCRRQCARSSDQEALIGRAQLSSSHGHERSRWLDSGSAWRCAAGSSHEDRDMTTLDPRPTAARRLKSIKALAEELDVSVSTLRREIKLGKLHPRRVGRQLRFEPEEVTR